MFRLPIRQTNHPRPKARSSQREPTRLIHQHKRQYLSNHRLPPTPPKNIQQYRQSIQPMQRRPLSKRHQKQPHTPRYAPHLPSQSQPHKRGNLYRNKKRQPRPLHQTKRLQKENANQRPHPLQNPSHHQSTHPLQILKR